MTFALTDWMLYSMWVVLGAMGLNFLLGLYQSLKNSTFSSDLITKYLTDLLMLVFPLFLLAGMTVFDKTDWIMETAYYIGAFGVVVKYLMDLKGKL
ncbi:hypothetical protein [Paenibacillus sacheonensis]|uniref:Uncharacterized protein n=1 Tax=Paenibacillus sacheonensis TaxID=742054 RepID=A0A7X4YKU8_9BACL|nr:hypothetical protein [Paenibacillus sacheonensis]MBM7563195.1 hypothetical protein [Paenibacillus sacheonensis]NBC68242.1 hypothetical protein [Paenibacillus sacheonensis]